ncbi:hypothetical protein KY290_015321 [Solanum tuberosum]|uniref:C2 NT-type domain-containing protein n=3 Tax=Solanum tuberosum TaxID=4113 RepID=A0ABQ7VS99_SOLTU|nr:hypothetical protein KY289_014935 [Solanum tuberosum]KAH0771340.1 hypothetical protein KY290_015321 [Solanum tuberosum]
MVLGQKKKKKGASFQIDYIVNIQLIRPWPPSESLRSVQSVLLQWENGDRNSGFVTASVEDDYLEINKTFTLFLTLCREKKSKDKFLKNNLDFSLYEYTKDNAAQGPLLGTASINFGEYGIIRETLAISVPLNCKKSSKSLLQPSLYVKVQPTKDKQESDMMIDDAEYDSDFASCTDDDVSSHSSSTFSSSVFEAAWGSPSNNVKVARASPSRLEKSDLNEEAASGTSKSEENTQHAKEKYIDRLISKITSSHMHSQAGMDSQNSADETTDHEFGHDDHLHDDTRDLSENKIAKSIKRQVTMSWKALGVQITNGRLKPVKSVQIRDSMTPNVFLGNTEIIKNEMKEQTPIETSIAKSTAVEKKELKNTVEKKEPKSTAEKKEPKSTVEKKEPKNTTNTTSATEKRVPANVLSKSKPEPESRIQMLEEELKEAAAIEVGLYSVVAEHGSSMNKVHTPARRLARFYLHAWRTKSPAKQASAARAAVSGLALVSKACGSDVPRLTFWLSNSIMLRAIISQAAAGLQFNEGAPTETTVNRGKSALEKIYMQQSIKYIANQGNKNYLVKQYYNWEDIESFTQALEKLEGWIFSKITKSLWWQTLTPHMQFGTAKTSKTRASRVKKTYGSRHSLGDQEQGKFSVKLWKRALKDACERLCPLRALGHKCGCLPVLPKLVMKQLVSRLDVAMFNAILRESTEEMPTDPMFDPISDRKVLPIPPGKSSFGAGAQLKNAVGSWSRWLTDLIGFEDEDSPEHSNIFGNDKKTESFKAFRLLNALSNLMMLPFEVLIDASTRKEVCPIFSPALIKRVLANFVPDEFRPNPIPKNVVETLDSEDVPGEHHTSFPCTATWTAYTPPPALSLTTFIEKVGNQVPKSTGSSVLKKTYTSDVELDELDSPFTSFLADSFKDYPNLAKPARNVVRYQLLREAWKQVPP